MARIIVPPSRPKMRRDDLLSYDPIRSLFIGNPTAATSQLMLIAIRGYYAVTMGPTEDNDIGIYDDAAFWIWSDRHGQHCRSFNYNTEPSKLTKGVATLKPGLYWYQKQLHRGQYPAFGQASKVYVQRHLQFLDHGFFGINLHYGSGSDTWSLGCQTVPKQQWPEFQHLGYEQLDRLSQRTFPYLLVTNRGDGKL